MNVKNGVVLLMLGAMMSLYSCGKGQEMGEEMSVSTGDIVGGVSVTKKDVNARSVVGLVMDKEEGQAMCTGSIVSGNVILTAAHCVEDSPRRVRLVFGPILQKANPTMVREVDHYIIHPNWGKHLASGEGDLALVHFKGNLPEGYMTAHLAPESLNLKPGQVVLMEGYGVTNGETHVGAGKLRKTTTHILERHSPTEIVTDGEKTSVCFGDSGGPAFVKNGKDTYLWGVASSVSNSSCNDTSIHTEIMKYLPWIKTSLTKMQK